MFSFALSTLIHKAKITGNLFRGGTRQLQSKWRHWEDLQEIPKISNEKKMVNTRCDHCDSGEYWKDTGHRTLYSFCPSLILKSHLAH